MATLNQILAEQMKLIGEAKNTLETAQKKPPPTTAPIAIDTTTTAISNMALAALPETWRPGPSHWLTGMTTSGTANIAKMTVIAAAALRQSCLPN